jgi:hypothetical protein
MKDCDKDDDENDIKTVSFYDDLSNFDAIFIDFAQVSLANLRDTLFRFHDKPTSYIIIYNHSILNTTWSEYEMSEIGDIVDDFMENHVRWQIENEPFLHKNQPNWEDNVFLLRGNTL